MLLVVDIQYHVDNKDKILKEACILPILSHPLHPLYFAFKAPFPFGRLSRRDQQTAHYVSKELGVLKWWEGHQNVPDFISLFSNGDIILCNGYEKFLFLQALLPFCYVLNVNITFSKFSTPHRIICPFRKHAFCSMTRVYQIYEFLRH
jgi:hypothetical protein